MKKLIFFAVLALSGCVSVYGPIKSGHSQSPTDNPTDDVSNQLATAALIDNRHPDELFNKATVLLKSKELQPVLANAQTGIIAVLGDNAALADTYLDCSALQQAQPLQRQYRLVVQLYSAGEGCRVNVQVSGTAQLTAADGNDKVKPTECRSNGVFEKDMLEALRK